MKNRLLVFVFLIVIPFISFAQHPQVKNAKSENHKNVKKIHKNETIEKDKIEEREVQSEINQQKKTNIFAKKRKFSKKISSEKKSEDKNIFRKSNNKETDH